MIQTIQVIDAIDKRCLRVQFHKIDFPINEYEQQFINADSHALTYYHVREQFKEMGDVMGLDEVKE